MQKYPDSLVGVTPFPSIGAAVIGSGFIGTVHIEALRRIGVRVTGLLGSTPERGAERAARRPTAEETIWLACRQRRLTTRS